MLMQNRYMTESADAGGEGRALISLSDRIVHSLKDGARMLLVSLLMVSFFVPVHATGSDDETETATEGRVAKARAYFPSQNDDDDGEADVSLHSAENSSTPDNRWKTSESSAKRKTKTKKKVRRAEPISTSSATPSVPSSLNVSSEAVEKHKGVEVTIDVGSILDDQDGDKSPNLQTDVPDTLEDDCMRGVLGVMGAFRGLTTILSQVANVVSLHYSDLSTAISADPVATTSTIATMMTTVADTSSTSAGMMVPDPMALSKYYGLVSVIAGGSSTVIQGLSNAAAKTEARLQASLGELIKEYNQSEENLLQMVPANKRHQAAFTLHLDDPDEMEAQPITHTKKSSNFMSRLNGVLTRVYSLLDGLVDWASWGCNTSGWVITAVLTFDESLSEEQKVSLLSASAALRSTGIVLQCLPALIVAEKIRLHEELEKIKGDIARLNKNEVRKRRALQAAEGPEGE